MTTWLLGGTAIFLVGWIAVGLPIIAFGERVSSIKYVPIIALASGVGGALILFLPDLLIRMTDRDTNIPGRVPTWSGLVSGSRVRQPLH
jgi:hypothetical protein